MTADDILGAGPSGGEKQREAEEFLSEFLRDGRKRATKVIREAKKRNIKPSIVHKAAKAIGVVKDREGYQGKSYWELPS